MQAEIMHFLKKKTRGILTSSLKRNTKQQRIDTAVVKKTFCSLDHRIFLVAQHSASTRSKAPIGYFEDSAAVRFYAKAFRLAPSSGMFLKCPLQNILAIDARKSAMYDCMVLATPLPAPENVSRPAKRQPVYKQRACIQV